jgi:hypothetical protein
MMQRWADYLDAIREGADGSALENGEGLICI